MLFCGPLCTVYGLHEMEIHLTRLPRVKTWSVRHDNCTLRHKYEDWSWLHAIQLPAATSDWFACYVPKDLYVVLQVRRLIMTARCFTASCQVWLVCMLLVKWLCRLVCCVTSAKTDHDCTLFYCLSPDVILCGWLGSKHQLTNCLTATCQVWVDFLLRVKWLCKLGNRSERSVTAFLQTWKSKWTVTDCFLSYRCQVRRSWLPFSSADQRPGPSEGSGNHRQRLHWRSGWQSAPWPASDWLREVMNDFDATTAYLK